MSESKLEESIVKARQKLQDLTAKSKVQIDKKVRDLKAKELALKKRRESLLGIALSHALENDLVDISQVLAWLDASLTRDKDRLFFGLPVDGDSTSH